MGEDAKQSWQWLLCSCRVVTQAKAPGDSRWPLAILVPGPCPHRSYGHLERAHSKFCSGLQQCWECVWRGARGPWTCHFLILAVPLLSHSCILGMQEAGRGLSFPTQPAPMDGTLARGVSMYKPPGNDTVLRTYCAVSSSGNNCATVFLPWSVGQEEGGHCSSALEALGDAKRWNLHWGAFPPLSP